MLSWRPLAAFYLPWNQFSRSIPRLAHREPSVSHLHFCFTLPFWTVLIRHRTWRLITYNWSVLVSIICHRNIFKQFNHFITITCNRRNQTTNKTRLGSERVDKLLATGSTIVLVVVPTLPLAIRAKYSWKWTDVSSSVSLLLKRWSFRHCLPLH